MIPVSHNAPAEAEGLLRLLSGPYSLMLPATGQSRRRSILSAHINCSHHTIQADAAVSSDRIVCSACSHGQVKSPRRIQTPPLTRLLNKSDLTSHEYSSREITSRRPSRSYPKTQNKHSSAQRSVLVDPSSTAASSEDRTRAL